MTDTVESLTAQVKSLKDAKASAPEIKAANDKLVALKKAAGQAKKKAEAKPDEDDEGGSAPVKVEAKETPKPAAATPKPTTETPKAAAAETPKAEPAAKGTKKAVTKPDTAKTEPAKLETPKADERKKSEKAEPRKKSEKVEETPTKKETTPVAADRKKSEKATATAATPTGSAEDSVDALAAKVSELKVAKPAKKGDATAEPKAANKKGGKATTPVAASDDPPTAAEPVKVTDTLPAATTSPEAAEVSSPGAAETAKKGGGKKNSERKQSTKAEPNKAEESPKPETKSEESVKIHTASGRKKIRILAISGSLRKESFNTALLRAAQKSAPSNVEIVIADITGIPLFNQDTEYEPNSAVKKFKDEIAAADAILFATPEYNYSLPGVLKNAIDVASRPWGQNSWANKRTGIWSASVGGFGGLRAQLALRQIAVFLKLNIYPGDEFLISDASNKFNASGLSDPATQEKVAKWIGEFSKWVQE